jgi:integrase
MGDMDIQEVTVSIVQEYINSKAHILAAKTIKEHINLMAAAFDGAVEDDLISRNPFRSKRINMIGKQSVTVEAYTEDEYRNFEKLVLPCLEESTKLFAAITLYTGMRRGEICALRWEDITPATKSQH